MRLSLPQLLQGLQENKSDIREAYCHHLHCEVDSQRKLPRRRACCPSHSISTNQLSSRSMGWNENNDRKPAALSNRREYSHQVIILLCVDITVERLGGWSLSLQQKPLLETQFLDHLKSLLVNHQPSTFAWVTALSICLRDAKFSLSVQLRIQSP